MCQGDRWHMASLDKYSSHPGHLQESLASADQVYPDIVEPEYSANTGRYSGPVLEWEERCSSGGSSHWRSGSSEDG